MTDTVNHPAHYKSHPSGIECIQVTEHMNFNLGNAIKYIWRCDEKGDPLENLNKAIWYLSREVARRGSLTLVGKVVLEPKVGTASMKEILNPHKTSRLD